MEQNIGGKDKSISQRKQPNTRGNKKIIVGDFDLGSALEETKGTLEEMSDLMRMNPRCECGEVPAMV